MASNSYNYEAIVQNEQQDVNIEGSSSRRSSMVDSYLGNGGTRRRRRNSKSHIGVQGEASWTSCVINLLNTIVGAGVLAMPGAMSKFGMTLGIFVILFSGFTSGFGLYLQSRCARFTERGNASFFSLSQLTYPNAAVVFDGAIAIKCFGVGVSYLIIIGNLMPLVVRGLLTDASGVLLERQFWITAFMIIVIPLSFLRRLDSLKYTSFIALVSIGYLVIIVLGHWLKGDTLADRGEVNLVKWSGAISALSSFPVMVFAYTCHQNMFSILNEIEDNSHKSTTSVITGSIGSAAVIYLLVAITGYLSYGSNVNGNIISMYPPSVASTIGRAAIVILVMFSYPLQIHPCRASIDNILKWRPAKTKSSSGPGSSPLIPGPIVSKPSTLGGGGGKEGAYMSDLRFAIITSVVLVLSFVVAMSVSSLERVLAYVGSTGSTSISFILPGLFYWKISDPKAEHIVHKIDDDEDLETFHADTDSWRMRLLRKGALALAVYGFVVMGVCLVLNVAYGGGGGH
ncbi:transmembrane amino acid transporter protein-domain-containing protein [Peziza echinospora]|nr:transmembrane amino acid transporter protein-domain-containing protein [Peziza echinospora]